MTKTMVLDGIEAFPQIMAAVVEDIDRGSDVELLNDELMRLSDRHKMYFDSSTGPDGAGWKENARSTIQQKKHSRILFGIPRNGFRLSTSLTAKATQSFGDAIREAIQEQPGIAYLAFGTSVEYSQYNNNRPHVGIDSVYLDGMTERAADYRLKQLVAA